MMGRHKRYSPSQLVFYLTNSVALSWTVYVFLYPEAIRADRLPELDMQWWITAFPVYLAINLAVQAGRLYVRLEWRGAPDQARETVYRAAGAVLAFWLLGFGVYYP